MMLAIHLIFCSILFWSVFCRSVTMTGDAKLDIRFAFFMLGVAAVAGMAAPWAWGFAPTGYTLTLLGSVALVQVTTAKHWTGGVPPDFVKPTKVAS